MKTGTSASSSMAMNTTQPEAIGSCSASLRNISFDLIRAWGQSSSVSKAHSLVSLCCIVSKARVRRVTIFREKC